MKQAIIFKAKLPSSQSVESVLCDFSFKPVNEMEFGSHGFEFTDKTTGRYASLFEGGYSLTYRLDQKIIPPSVVKEKLNEEVEVAELQIGRNLKRKEKDIIKSEIIADMLPTAFVKTQRVEMVYSEKTETLYVATSNQKKAQVCVSGLVRAMGSLKTTTIHIDNIKVGLAKKISESICDDAVAPVSFGNFFVGGSLVLVGKENDKISYTIDDVRDRAEDIESQIDSGYKVKQTSLIHQDCVSFKINEKFSFSQIKLLQEIEDEDFEDKNSKQRHVKYLTVAMMDAAVKELCDIFEYKEQQ